jgi:hypothetical protein
LHPAVATRPSGFTSNAIGGIMEYARSNSRQ